MSDDATTKPPAVGSRALFALFEARLPDWANGPSAGSPEEALQRAKDVAHGYYPLGQQTGIHSMIEWCGVMVEYTKMLEEASRAGHDPREVDKHHGISVEIPDFMVSYFCEKLGCQLIPFMRGNIELWREEIEGWFTEANDKV